MEKAARTSTNGRLDYKSFPLAFAKLYSQIGKSVQEIQVREDRTFDEKRELLESFYAQVDRHGVFVCFNSGGYAVYVRPNPEGDGSIQISVAGGNEWDGWLNLTPPTEFAQD